MIPVPVPKLQELRKQFIERTGLGSGDYRITACSPWPSELFALHALGVRCKVASWAESGTYHGQAIEVLAKANPECQLRTVEFQPAVAAVARQRLEWLGDRVAVLEGDGSVLMPAMVDTLSGPVGVFLDGPKSLEALLLARKLLERWPKVAFVGMHDMSQSVGGRAVPARAAIEELGRWESDHWVAWATDDPEYVAWARDLDEGLHARHVNENGHSGWRPHELFIGSRTWEARSYGPTVAFLIRRAGLE